MDMRSVSESGGEGEAVSLTVRAHATTETKHAKHITGDREHVPGTKKAKKALLVLLSPVIAGVGIALLPVAVVLGGIGIASAKSWHKIKPIIMPKSPAAKCKQLKKAEEKHRLEALQKVKMGSPKNMKVSGPGAGDIAAKIGWDLTIYSDDKGGSATRQRMLVRHVDRFILAQGQSLRLTSDQKQALQQAFLNHYPPGPEPDVFTDPDINWNAFRDILGDAALEKFKDYMTEHQDEIASGLLAISEDKNTRQKDIKAFRKALLELHDTIEKTNKDPAAQNIAITKKLRKALACRAYQALKHDPECESVKYLHKLAYAMHTSSGAATGQADLIETLAPPQMHEGQLPLSLKQTSATGEVSTELTRRLASARERLTWVEGMMREAPEGIANRREEARKTLEQLRANLKEASKQEAAAHASVMQARGQYDQAEGPDPKEAAETALKKARKAEVGLQEATRQAQKDLVEREESLLAQMEPPPTREALQTALTEAQQAVSEAEQAVAEAVQRGRPVQVLNGRRVAEDFYRAKARGRKTLQLSDGGFFHSLAYGLKNPGQVRGAVASHGGKVGALSGSHYDPHLLPNNSSLHGSTTIDVSDVRGVRGVTRAQIQNIHGPSPTVAGHVAPEFLALCQGAENNLLWAKEHDDVPDPDLPVKVVFTNLQKLNESAGEGVRSKALMELNDQFPGVCKVLTLSKDSEFYKMHDTGPLEWKSSEDFSKKMERALFSGVGRSAEEISHDKGKGAFGIYFPPSVTPELLNNALDVANRRFSPEFVREKFGEPPLEGDRAFKVCGAYQEYVYQLIQRQLEIEAVKELAAEGVKGGNIIFKASCKEHADRGGMNSMAMAYLRAEIPPCAPLSEIDHLRKFVIGSGLYRALAAKERMVLDDRVPNIIAMVECVSPQDFREDVDAMNGDRNIHVGIFQPSVKAKK